MKELKVPNMMCINCQNRIEKGLASEGIECRVELSKKSVFVPVERAEDAAKVLDELGFDVA